MLIIGLTGSLKTGKSTVAGMLTRLGAGVLNADEIAHRHMKQKGRCFRAVVKEFGSAILTRGVIDRRKLADIVFKNKTKLQKLEQIVHPFVIDEMTKAIARYGKDKRNKIVVVDVPLLFETGLDRRVDMTVVVKAKQITQVIRAVEDLGITRAEALRRIKRQIPLKEKVRRADITIDNDGTYQQTQNKVKVLWQKLMKKKKI